MALRNLIVCINDAGGQNDLPCVVLHSASREACLHAARCVLAALRPNGPTRRERHVMPAVDPGRHSTFFEYERAKTSLLIDLSQSEVARSASVDWISPIAPMRHVEGTRRSIVLHCADMLSWAHQNSLKKVIESSHSQTLFILTTSQPSALQAAIISRGVVIRCPAHVIDCIPKDVPIDMAGALTTYVGRVEAAVSPGASSRVARETAYHLSKMYVQADSSVFLRHVLDNLMSQLPLSRDTDRWDVVDDMSSVDLQLAAVSSAGKRVTFATAMHGVLLRQAMRLKRVA